MTWFNLKILQAYIEKPNAVLVSQQKKHKKCRKIHKFVKKIIQMNIMLYTISSINLIVILIRRSTVTLSLNNYPEFQVSFLRFQQSALRHKNNFLAVSDKKSLQFSNFKHSR